ncbi:hypothetical protein EVAR_84113_1 [Eumeta japonica]|uniref:Uncharacterized protein n=1 Tax=Eumeta variegata TaxID=151549 RepID=A0A4C1V078_EUMVA|nr:hypothetical protein EVAR_84113_1 [Eumeta japonica]
MKYHQQNVIFGREKMSCFLIRRDLLQRISVDLGDIVVRVYAIYVTFVAKNTCFISRCLSESTTSCDLSREAVPDSAGLARRAKRPKPSSCRRIILADVERFRIAESAEPQMCFRIFGFRLRKSERTQ